MERILITGGAGFIGSNLIEELNRVVPSVEVVSFDDYSTGSKENLRSLRVHQITGSILDRPAVLGAADGADCIVHLAALGSVPRSVKDPTTSHDVNVTGTVNVLEAARHHRVPQFIFASSSSVYGSNPDNPKRHSNWTAPASPYAASKLAAESYVLAYQHTFGLNSLAFRLFNVYGPKQSAEGPYSAVIPRFMEACIAGQRIEVHGDGTQSRDFTYVKNVAEVISTSIQARKSSPRPVNLAFGVGTSVLRLASLIEDLGKTTLDIDFLPPRPGDVHTSLGDPSELQGLFPRVSRTSIEEGLERTLNWRLHGIPN